jgi:hypothetical protein
MHLDFTELGAQEAGHQPQSGGRVMLDPAGTLSVFTCEVIASATEDA